MKFTIPTILSLLTAAVSATPLQARDSASVTLALSNDQSGANAGVSFPADGSDRDIFPLFIGTAVGATGSVLASSAQLTAFPQGVSCVLKNYGAVITTLTAANTFVDLNGDPASNAPVNLNGGVINCHA